MEDYKKYLPMTLETRDSYDLWLKYDDEYLVSVTSQRVKALNYHKRGIVYELVPRIVVKKSSIGQVAYACVSIHGKPKELHTVIIEAIHGKLPKGLEVDHINTDGTDNYLLNLRICTHLENMQNPLTVQHKAEAMQKLSQDPEWLQNVSEANKRKAQDPEWRKNVAEANKRKAQDPEWLKNTAEGCRKRSQDPEWQRKNAEANKKLAQDPEWQKNHSEAMQKLSEDPEWRKKHAEGCRKRSQNQEWQMNNAEAVRKARSKPVDQFTLDGIFVKTWESATDAARELGIYNSAIGKCCIDKRKSAGGYVWRYA